jgi:hypothetical protein
MRKLLLVVLITNLITAGLVWQFQANKHSSEVWKLRHEFATIQLDSMTKTKEDERLLNEKYTEALQNANIREQKSRTELDNQRIVSDRLRYQVSEANRKLATASAAATTEYAAALNLVFDSCREAYGGMAEKATGHANDAAKLIEAWPKYSKP